MAFLKRAELIRLYDKKQSTLLDESGERRFAAKRLREHGEKFTIDDTYDIFLSHSYDDARIIKQIKEMLEEKGYTVYVDWIEDSHLNRRNVDSQSANLLRRRMNSCASLLYATSESAEESVWMPWELGYMDAKTGRVAVAPILNEEDTGFKGREYLGLYPYVDLTGDSFYIHRSDSDFDTFSDWIER